MVLRWKLAPDDWEIVGQVWRALLGHRLCLPAQGLVSIPESIQMYYRISWAIDRGWCVASGWIDWNFHQETMVLGPVSIVRWKSDAFAIDTESRKWFHGLYRQELWTTLGRSPETCLVVCDVEQCTGDDQYQCVAFTTTQSRKSIGDLTRKTRSVILIYGYDIVVLRVKLFTSKATKIAFDPITIVSLTTNLAMKINQRFVSIGQWQCS